MNLSKKDDYPTMKAFPATMALEDTLHFLNQAPPSSGRKRRRAQYETTTPNRKLQLAILESSLKVLDLDVDFDFPAIEWNFSSDEEDSSRSENKSPTALSAKSSKSSGAALQDYKEKTEHASSWRRANKRGRTSLTHSKHDTLVRCRSFLGHLSSFESASGLIRSESLPRVAPISEGSS